MWKDEENEVYGSGSDSEDEEMEYERNRSRSDCEEDEEGRGPLDRFADLGLASRGPSRRASPTPFSRREANWQMNAVSPPRSSAGSTIHTAIPMSMQSSVQMGSYPHPHHYQPYPALTQALNQQQQVVARNRDPHPSMAGVMSAPVSRTNSSARLGNSISSLASSRNTSQAFLPITHQPHPQGPNADLSALSLLASSELYEIERAEREREHLHLHPLSSIGSEYHSYQAEDSYERHDSRVPVSANVLPHPPPLPVSGISAKSP